MHDQASSEAEDVFAQSNFGRVALRKLAQAGALPEGFQLFSAAWLGQPCEFEVMQVKGCQFVAAKSGRFAGQLVCRVRGTVRSVLVTKAELDAERAVAVAVKPIR